MNTEPKGRKGSLLGREVGHQEAPLARIFTDVAHANAYMLTVTDLGGHVLSVQSQSANEWDAMTIVSVVPEQHLQALLDFPATTDDEGPTP